MRPPQKPSGQRGRFDLSRESGQPVRLGLRTTLESPPYLPNLHPRRYRSRRSLHHIYYTKFSGLSATGSPPYELNTNPSNVRNNSPNVSLSGRAVERVRGRRRQLAFANLIGLSERTLRRMERDGASLTQALAIAFAELAAGNLLHAAYVLAMIGETADLMPRFARAIPWRPEATR